MTAEVSKVLPLDRPMPIADVARFAGMRTRQMRRWLMRTEAKHRDEGKAEALLIRVNGRWMVPSIAHLRKFWPDFAKRFSNPEDVEALQQEVQDLRRDSNALRARLRAVEAFHKRLLPLLEPLVMERENALGGALERAGRSVNR